MGILTLHTAREISFRTESAAGCKGSFDCAVVRFAIDHFIKMTGVEVKGSPHRTRSPNTALSP